MKKAKVVKMNFRNRCEVYEVAEKMLGELQPALVVCCIRITDEKVSLWLSEMIQKVTGYSDPLQDYNEDLIVIMDMVRGHVEPDYDDEELIDCARIIKRTAEKILEDWNKKNTAKDFERMWKKFSKEAAKAVKGNFWNPWYTNDIVISKEYLQAWLERKYWNK